MLRASGSPGILDGAGARPQELAVSSGHFCEQGGMSNARLP